MKHETVSQLLRRLALEYADEVSLRRSATHSIRRIATHEFVERSAEKNSKSSEDKTLIPCVSK